MTVWASGSDGGGEGTHAVTLTEPKLAPSRSQGEGEGGAFRIVPACGVSTSHAVHT